MVKHVANCSLIMGLSNVQYVQKKNCISRIGFKNRSNGGLWTHLPLQLYFANGYVRFEMFNIEQLSSLRPYSCIRHFVNIYTDMLSRRRLHV